MNHCQIVDRDSGFTLVEVMIALAILALNLVVILTSVGQNIRDSERSQRLSAVISLARGKLYDLEEKLFRDGFPVQSQNFEGKFDEEDWPDIRWQAEIQPVELPELSSVERLGQQAEDGAEDSSAESPLMQMLSGLGVGGLAGSGEEGGGLMATFLPQLAQGIKESVRKIILTVSWNVGNQEETMVVDFYVTDIGGVDRALGGFATLGQQSGTSAGGTLSPSRQNSGSRP